MDERVRQFIQETVQTIIGLDIVLFFQANPDTFDTPAGLALRLRRQVAQIEPILVRLAGHGILEVHPRGDGQYQCYALVRSPQVWNLLCLLSEAYLDDPHTRKQIVHMLIGQQWPGQDPAPAQDE